MCLAWQVAGRASCLLVEVARYLGIGDEATYKRDGHPFVARQQPSRDRWQAWRRHVPANVARPDSAYSLMQYRNLSERRNICEPDKAGEALNWLLSLSSLRAIRSNLPSAE